MPVEAVTVLSSVAGMDHEVWRYTYVLARLNPQWTDVPLTPNWETAAVKWIAPGDLETLPLHPDLLTDLPILRAAVTATLLAP